MKMKKFMCFLSSLCTLLVLTTGCGLKEHNASTNSTIDIVEPIPFIVQAPEKATNEFQYYTSLSEVQQEMYTNLSSIHTNHSEEIVMYTYSGTYQDDLLKDAQIALMTYQMDHPEDNQFVQDCIVYNSPKDNSNNQYVITAVYSRENSSMSNELKKQEQSDAVAHKFIKTLDGKTDEQKYQAIHDWLATCEYDYNMGDESHTLYGTLVERKAVCDGLAYTYKYMCDLLELPCVVVIGSTDGLTGDIGHAWNLIPIDGNWKLVDVTYDLYLTEKNESTDIDHSYFMIDDLNANNRRPYSGYNSPGYFIVKSN